MSQSPSLASRLTKPVLAIVAAMALILSISNVLVTRAILTAQLDASLHAALVRQQGGRDGDRRLGANLPGMPLGTIIVVNRGQNTFSSEVGDAVVNRPAEETVEALLAVEAWGRPRNIDLPELGRYRVRTAQVRASKVIVALPMAGVLEVLARQAAISAGVGALALGLAAAATTYVARRSTRGLQELSATASRVAATDLMNDKREDVQRVEARTGSREVVALTQAFNAMLSNVDGALTQRRESEAKLRRFVADASHELRNPLAAIRGYAELASREVCDDPQFALSRIESESQRMSKLVNDLLLLARLDAEPMAALSNVDLTEVTLNALADARVAGPEHQWRLRAATEPLQVRADADQLHQVVANLLNNARTHTPPGTIVEASLTREDHSAVLRVSDDGPGIDPQLSQRVFDRFARGDSSRTHTSGGSTGLGLAIVHAVVSSIGGTVSVSSQPGQTVFRVELPLVG